MGLGNGVNALTGLPFDAAYLWNDPYFQQAYATPNAKAGSTGTSSTPTGTTSTSTGETRTSLPDTNINFKGNTQNTATKGGKNWALGGIGIATVAGGALYIASRGKAGKGVWNKLATGWDDIVKNGLFKKAQKEAASWKDRILCREVKVGGTNTRMVNIPNEVRTLNATTDASTIRNLGIDTTIARNFDDVANIRATGFEAEITHGGFKNRIIVKDGKLHEIKGKGTSGRFDKDVMNDYNSNADFKKAVDEYIEKVLKRDKDALKDKTLKNLDYEYAIDDILYQCRADKVGRTGTLQSIQTNRYLASEDKVSTLLANLDDEAQKVLRNFRESGRTKDLKEAIVEYTHNGDKWRFVDGEPVAFYNGSRWIEKGVAGDVDLFNAKIMSSEDYLEKLTKGYSKAKSYNNPIYELVL